MEKIKNILKKVLLAMHVDINSYRPKWEYYNQYKLIPEAKIIFDVGAHSGETVGRYRKYFPLAQIYSFEPFNSAFKELEMLVSGDKNTHPLQLALTDMVGNIKFYANSAKQTNSVYKPEDIDKRFYHDHDKYYSDTKEIEVASSTIDIFCKERSIEGIDILKMDVQGGELKALIGAKDMISKHRIKVIFFEVSFIKIYARQPLFHEIQDWLNIHGYTLYNLYYLSPSSEGQLVAADAIFVSLEIKNKFSLK
jgi:FkbM family methyltransferase